MHSFVMGSYQFITNCGWGFRTYILYSRVSSDVRNQTERKEEAKEEGCSAAVEAEISVQVEDQKEI